MGLDGSLGALLQQIESCNNGFGKRLDLTVTADMDALASCKMCVPDWAKTAFGDFTAQEYFTSFALPRGSGGVLSANRAPTGQARMYPLAQAALNLRALWLLWVQKTLAEDKDKGCEVRTDGAAGVLKMPMKVSPSTLSPADRSTTDPNAAAATDASSAVVRIPTAILTRWLSDWAAKRARSTGNSSTNDLTLANINNKNSKSKVNNGTPSLTRTSSRSLASSAGKISNILSAGGICEVSFLLLHLSYFVLFRLECRRKGPV